MTFYGRLVAGESPLSRDLVDSLADVDFLLGGVNLHQDLHFATFYLRASLSSETGSEYPGYSLILAHYEAGTEQYFILEDDARRTATWLIERCVADPKWLCEKLEAIERTSWDLATAFPGNVPASAFETMSTDGLLALYLRHNELHRAMYHYARIPEALDRGRPYFTDYLKRQLQDAGVSTTDLASVFEALTAPQIPSVIADEERMFNAIVEKSLVAVPDLPRLHTPTMFLPAAILDALDHHRKRWGWLRYHGYRHRSLPTADDYVQRLCTAAINMRRIPEVRAADLRGITERLGPQHRMLLSLYSEVGRVKLLRRYLQLRNFYFLDLLLATIARRLNVTEWEVRCCFPEELEAALRSGQLDSSIRARLQRCGVIYTPDGEAVLDEAELVSVLKRVNVQKKRTDDPTTRLGTTACVGIARGKARIVGMTADVRPPFRDGEIVICMAADPDLIPIIRRASAVVSQEGGVTSHASLLCREIGVPTIIGVEDLMEFIHEGDEVEVDATRGTIRRLNRVHPSRMRNSLVVPEQFWHQPERVGRKAANLQIAVNRGFDVPPFALLSFDEIERLLEDDDLLRQSLAGICATLDSRSIDSTSFLLRSSALDEDGDEGSQAGKYVSIAMSIPTDPIRAVREFVERNRRVGYRGVVILQRFVPAVVSGVSIDGDMRTDAEGKLIIELVRGSLNSVTAGRGEIQRIVYDYLSQEILSATATGRAPYAIADVRTGDLVEWLSAVSGAFQRPTYAEWGFFANRYWLYQVRGSAI